MIEAEGTKSLLQLCPSHPLSEQMNVATWFTVRRHLTVTDSELSDLVAHRQRRSSSINTWQAKCFLCFQSVCVCTSSSVQVQSAASLYGHTNTEICQCFWGQDTLIIRIRQHLWVNGELQKNQYGCGGLRLSSHSSGGTGRQTDLREFKASLV